MKFSVSIMVALAVLLFFTQASADEQSTEIKAVLVTGATSDIGRATASKYSRS